MSDDKSASLADSVKARLKNKADSLSVLYNLILTRYGIERFLYKISVSEWKDKVILKGGMLFVLWTKGVGYRPTMDSDFLWRGDASKDELIRVFKAICDAPTDLAGGLRFDSGTVAGSEIRSQTDYGGTRITLTAFLGNSRIPLQFDIGVGDAVTPPAVLSAFPTLLGLPPPRLKTYPIPTVIAEKIETMVVNGMANSRMKDFYDLHVLTTRFPQNTSTVREAVRNTFARRGTRLPTGEEECFSTAFQTNPQKQIQWTAFLRKNRLADAPALFRDVAEPVGKYVLSLRLNSESSPQNP
jgi:hypothetical protein